MATLQPATFGTLLKRYRTANGLTQEELAERSRLSVRAISDLERGVRRTPYRDTVQQLEDALELAARDRLTFEAAARGSGEPLGSGASALLLTGAFLGAAPEGRLVAREEELSRLVAGADAVLEGAGRVVLLTGEPGVGKTRLAQEVTRELRARGFLVATGRCYESEQAVPFHPFLEALSGAYAGSPEAVREEVAERWPHLGHLLPDRGIAPPDVSADSQGEQQKLLRSVSSFLQAIAATSPVALLLDDLHWADISSLRLFQYLTRYTRASPILLLGTYRDVESTWNHLLEQVLLDLNRERLVERIALRRLDSSGTAALLQAKLDEPNVSAELAELVHRSAEGNPFFTEELLRTLVENGGLYQRNGHWAWKAISELGVPETVRSAIVRRFSHLGERTQKSVQQASVLGQTFHFDDLRRMTGQQEDELEGALDEGLRAGLIRMVAGDDYSFNHALTQQALYAELSPRRRAGLHLAAADAIEGEEGGTRQRRAAELARHFLHAHAAERALPYALLAGDQAQAMFAHAEAERQYRTALELAQEVGDAVRQAEALEKLSRTLTHMVRYDEALAMLERAAETYRAAGDLEGEGGVTADIGWIYRAQGRPDEGLTRLRPMAEALETRGPSRSLARVHLMMSNIDLTAGDYDRGLAELERAAEVARAVKDDELLTMAERFRMSTLRWVGRADGVLEGMAGVLPVAEAEQDPIFLVQALNSASLASQFRGEFVKSKEYAERGLEIARRTGLPLDLAWTLNRVGCVATFMGDWKEAHAYFEEALHIVRAHGTTAMSPYPLMDLGNLLAGEGQWETAARYLDEAIALTEEMNDLLTLRWAQLHRAILNIVQEDPRAAITRLTPLLDRPGFEEFPVTPFLWVLAWAHLELGEEARAETLVLDSLRRARAQDNVLDLPPALRVQGMVLARQRRWEEAQRAFEEALSLTHAMSFPPAEAAILRDYGKMWAARGDRTRARQRLAEALAIFRRLGARIDVERTERALADLAGRRFTAIPE